MISGYKWKTFDRWFIFMSQHKNATAWSAHIYMYCIYGPIVSTCFSTKSITIWDPDLGTKCRFCTAAETGSKDKGFQKLRGCRKGVLILIDKIASEQIVPFCPFCHLGHIGHFGHYGHISHFRHSDISVILDISENIGHLRHFKHFRHFHLSQLCTTLCLFLYVLLQNKKLIRPKHQ